MPEKIVLATTNPGKLKELERIAKGHLLARSGKKKDFLELVLAPPGFEVSETGKDYRENALLKARKAARLTGLLAAADDSGLEVDSLDNRPGLYSARYAEGNDRDRRLKLLSELEKFENDKRGARFVCHMVLYDPLRDVVLCHESGSWNGYIGKEERGSGGFGYDPIFYELESGMSAAEIDDEEKDLRSHRGIAWRKILDFLEKKFMAR